jgi:pyridinium-3,5-biscarboxylic acid mononucleotide sulfurtransferase
VDTQQLQHKLNTLRSILQDCGSVLIGYSGGVDSVFLARYAVDVLSNANVLAVTGRSQAVPEEQIQVARQCALSFGIPHLEVDTFELHDPNYTANPANRCYFCKTELWNVLSGIAAQRGLRTVVDGSNADDATDYRPGARAGHEWQVRSPLAEAGLSKAEIRRESRALGLPTWDQPASPCLSSRLPYGLAVTPTRLRQIEAAEQIIRDRGFHEFRVRHHGREARLEFAPQELGRAAAELVELTPQLRTLGFERVLLDVEGYRRGALNEALVTLRSLK